MQNRHASDFNGKWLHATFENIFDFDETPPKRLNIQCRIANVRFGSSFASLWLSAGHFRSEFAGKEVVVVGYVTEFFRLPKGLGSLWAGGQALGIEGCFNCLGVQIILTRGIFPLGHGALLLVNQNRFTPKAQKGSTSKSRTKRGHR